MEWNENEYWFEAYCFENQIPDVFERMIVGIVDQSVRIHKC